MPRIIVQIGTILWLPQQVLAESVQNQGFTPPPPVISTGNMLQLSAGLFIVLAFIALIAWLFKKIGFNPANRTGLLKIISSASIGQKERVVIAEIDDTWLVLGVAPGQVNLLHQMHKKSSPSVETAEPPSGNSFTEKLQANLEQDHEQ